MKTKNAELLRYVIRTLAISIITPIITYLGVAFYNYLCSNNIIQCSQNIDIVCTIMSIIGCVFSVVIGIVIEHNLFKHRAFRKHARYEGKWIEIIPDFPERPITVCSYEYNSQKDEYLFYGENFYNNSERGLEFSANKFIFENGFYYITEQTKEQVSGVGKVTFNRSNTDGLTRAEGYFFDIANASGTKKHETIMIKYDESYFKK